MKDEDQKTPTFEEVTADILGNVREDRVRLLDVVTSMQKVAEECPEAALAMCEQIVKAHDVLNKMTQQAANLAGLLLKDKHKDDGKDGKDGIWEEIGDAFDQKRESEN